MFDEAISSDKLLPFVMVFPNCETKLGHSQYVNSTATGNYMDYVCDEVVSFVEEKYSVQKEARFRGVMGHSSGGFGSLVLGMKRPDVFSNICSSAGDSYYEYLYMNMIPKVIKTISKNGGIEKTVQKFLKSPNPFSLLPRDHGETVMVPQYVCMFCTEPVSACL